MMPGPAGDDLPAVVIERHCTCTTVPSREHVRYGPATPKLRVVTGCPLHDPDPRFDLPAEVLR